MRVDYDDYMQSAEWQEQANAAKGRAGHRCQVCNRPATAVTLEAHHRTYERLGQERAEDLTVLCRDCHALYEKNKRIPRPPPVQLPTREEIITSIPLPEPALPPVKQPLLFVPVKSSKPPATVPGQPSAPSLPIAPDSVYRLLPEQPTADTARLRQQAPSATGKVSHATRDSRIRITAILVILAMLSAVSLLDNDSLPSTSTEVPRPAPMRTVQPTVTSTVAASQTAIATQSGAPATQSGAPATQSGAPATPAAVVVPPIATAQPATVTVPLLPADPRQGIVNQTALVCQNPCSCAPVVRTIARGNQVNVLETQRCGLDTWVRIGAGEWLGPRFVDEIPTQ